MKFIAWIKSLFVTDKPEPLPLDVEVLVNTFMLIRETPEQRHLVVYGRLHDADRFMKQCEAFNMKAKIYFRQELPEALHQLTDGDTIPIVNASVAAIGWRAKCEGTFNVHCLSKQDAAHVTQLSYRARCDRSIVWNVNEVTILDRLQESAGVWFDDVPEVIKFNPRDFDRERPLLLQHIKTKNTGMT